MCTCILKNYNRQSSLPHTIIHSQGTCDEHFDYISNLHVIGVPLLHRLADLEAGQKDSSDFEKWQEDMRQVSRLNE